MFLIAQIELCNKFKTNFFVYKQIIFLRLPQHATAHDFEKVQVDMQHLLFEKCIKIVEFIDKFWLVKKSAGLVNTYVELPIYRPSALIFAVVASLWA